MSRKKRKVGRPSRYSPALAAEICHLLSGGMSLRKICASKGMPDVSTILDWLTKHEEFTPQYTRARELWAEAEFDNMMVIADTPQMGEKTEESIDSKGQSFSKTIRGDMIEHRRLQVDTRKWGLSRMFPRKYAERLMGERDTESESAKAVIPEWLQRDLKDSGATIPTERSDNSTVTSDPSSRDSAAVLEAENPSPSAMKPSSSAN